MARLSFAIACCVLAAGTAAEAQVSGVTGVTGASSTKVTLDGSKTFTTPGTFQQGRNGSSFASSIAINPTTISFESGNASSGGNVTSTSTSSVDITITNQGSKAVAPKLASQITAAGLGFYLADQSGGCGGDIFAGCPQTKGGQTFADLVTFSGASPGEVEATAEFDFNITAGGTTVYNFTGIEALVVGPDNKFVVDPLVLSAQGVLQGLQTVQLGGQGSDLGYSWDASNIIVGLGADLAPGDSRDIVYTSTVTTMSRTDCTSVDTSVCLVAYSAFGDPVGRGGGTTNVLKKFSPDGLNGVFGAPVDPTVANINFNTETFDAPTFNNGVLKFAPVGAVVPEPKTWMSLILGFSLLGAALRRRRIPSYT